MISGREIGGLAAGRLEDAIPAGMRTAAPVSGEQSHQETTDAVQTRAGKLVAAVRALPGERPAKIAEARARLASGQQPSSTDVARQILRRVMADRLAGG